jgi:Transposase, Mutator family
VAYQWVPPGSVPTVALLLTRISSLERHPQQEAYIHSSEIVASLSVSESEATYQELFRSLKARGLKGVELVVSDDHEGLKSAVSRHFQGAAHQSARSTT